ncbi:hypothetical protein HDU98_000828 [Podochytrium sp. JEL0797]|nr:hypothetical protein HDU98_000828 [Podochytrium sp. JEL0797]
MAKPKTVVAPLAKPVAKKAIEEDDEFEDFSAADKQVIDWDAVAAAEKELNAWEDVWEDDDEEIDFAVLLAAEKKKIGGATPMQL